MAVRRHRSVRTERLFLTRRFAKNLDGRFRWLANFRWLPSMALMRLTYMFFPLPKRKFDLIISAGGQTAAANMLLSRIYKAPNIFCGSHRNAKPKNFAQVLIPYSHMEGTLNHSVLLKPSPVDPDKMRAPLSLTNDNEPKKLTGAILLGASTSEYSYTFEDWTQILDITRMGEATGLVEWVATSSPRTPDQIGDLFAERALSDSALKEFVDFRTTGPGSIGRLVEAADFIIATEDSSSMVIEAICARRPTIAIAPKSKSPKEVEEKMLDELVGKKWLARLDIDENLNTHITAALSDLQPMEENHLDALAGVVLPLLKK